MVGQVGERRVRFPGMERVGRPPVGVRAGIGVLALGGLLFTALLLLSDRAPGVMRDVLGDAADRLWDRIDATRAQPLGQQARAQPDFVVHVVIWAAVTFLCALTIWTFGGVIAVMVGAFAASVMFELAQGAFTSTRAVEFRDVVGNACGVAIGGVAALLVVAASRALGTLARAGRRR